MCCYSRDDKVLLIIKGVTKIIFLFFVIFGINSALLSSTFLSILSFVSYCNNQELSYNSHSNALAQVDPALQEIAYQQLDATCSSFESTLRGKSKCSATIAKCSMLKYLLCEPLERLLTANDGRCKLHSYRQ
jgi:hypothetical protein